MKKTFFVILMSVVIMALSVPANAKIFRFGIKGGADFSNTTLKNIEELSSKNYTGFNVGAVMNVNLPLGFAIQPELLYTHTGVAVQENILKTKAKFTQGSIELPIGIQWGIQLGPVRPYITVIPHIGCAVLNLAEISDDASLKVKNDKPFQYGIGLGAGIDIWKFQLSFRYKWALNSFEFKEAVETIETKVQTAEISLAFLF